MKNTNMRFTRTFSAIAAAVMMTVTVSSFNAFAETADAVKSINLTSAIAQARLQKTAGEKLDDSARKLSKAMVDGSIDYMSTLVPGGRVIASPLKYLVGAAYDVDQGPSPIDILTDQEQAHFEQLSKMISDLDANMAKYAEMLTKQIDTVTGKRSLGEVFTELSTNLRDLNDRVNAIVECKDYTKEQKLLLIANVNNGSYRGEPYLVNVRQACDAISKTINYDGSPLTVDFFGTLMELGKPGSMFYDDALAKAKGFADPLISQYMYANYLLTVCQDAYTLIDFTPEEAEKICTTAELRDAYEKCSEGHDKLFQTEKLAQTYDRMSECIEATKKLDALKANGRKFINGGTDEVELKIIEDCQTIYSQIFKYLWKENYFDKNGITNLINYVRSTCDGKVSMIDYLRSHNSYREMIQTKCEKYLIIDTQTTDVRGARNGTVTEYYWVGDKLKSRDILMYNYTTTVKAIDMNDPHLRIIDLPVRTYRADSSNGRQRDLKEYANIFTFIGAYGS